MKIDKFDYNKTKNIIIDTISEIEETFNIDNGNFQFGYYKKNFKDIKNNIKVLISELKDKNINLFNFFKQYENEVFNDHTFVDHSAFMDAILYWYDKNKGILSGVKLENSSEYEYFIKYKYEYYNYDMGIKFILQSYNNMEEYYKDTAELLLLGIISPQYSSTNIGDNFSGTKNDAKKIVEKCSIIRKYNNVYTIYVHLNLLFTELSKDYTSYNYDKFIKTLMSDIGTIPFKIVDNIMLIYIGNTNNKISSKEFNDIKNILDINYQANIYNL